MRKVSIIVPTYNEKDNIELLIERIDSALCEIDHEIIFVDDSDDDTPDVIEKIAVNKPHVRLKHRTKEKGLATAVLAGFEMAEGVYLACMDADLQHPPEILYPMYMAMESGADYCLPSRFIKGGSDGGLNLYRKLVSATARKLGQIMLKSIRCVSDPTGGLFMVKKSVIDNSSMKPIGWKILIEALATSHYSRIIEIPYTFLPRNAGESKIDMKVTIEYLQQCMSLQKRSTINKNVIVKRWSPEKMKQFNL